MGMAKIYIGPSIPGLNKGTIFSSELPEYFRERLKELPHVQALIVPVEGLQKAKEALHEKGTVLNFHLQHLLDKEPQNGV